MTDRRLLTDDERRALFGVPSDPDDLARLFTLTRADQDLVAAHRGDANRLGVAVQLALLRHPGTTPANLGQQPEQLVTWLAGHLEIPATAFADQPRAGSDGRVTQVPGPFALSVVYLTTDALPSLKSWPTGPHPGGA